MSKSYSEGLSLPDNGEVNSDWVLEAIYHARDVSLLENLANQKEADCNSYKKRIFLLYDIHSKVIDSCGFESAQEDLILSEIESLRRAEENYLKIKGLKFVLD